MQTKWGRGEDYFHSSAGIIFIQVVNHLKTSTNGLRADQVRSALYKSSPLLWNTREWRYHHERINDNSKLKSFEVKRLVEHVLIYFDYFLNLMNIQSDFSQFKESQHKSWDSVSEGWHKWWRTFENDAQNVSSRLVELEQPKSLSWSLWIQEIWKWYCKIY